MMCSPGALLFLLTNPLYLHCLHNLRSCTSSNWFCHWSLPPPHVADNGAEGRAREQEAILGKPEQKRRKPSVQRGRAS